MGLGDQSPTPLQEETNAHGRRPGLQVEDHRSPHQGGQEEGGPDPEAARRAAGGHHTIWYWEAGKSKPTHAHLVELAFRCEASTDWLLCRDVVEAELLREADASFSEATAGLPREDLESIHEFIRFVRARRRGRA